MVRRGKRRRVGTNTLLVASVAGFVAVIGGLAVFTDLFEREVASSHENIFALQSVVDPTQDITCIAKFELRAFARNGQQIFVEQSTASQSQIFGPFKITERGTDPDSIARWEVEPELRCDDKLKTSGPINWGIKYPSQTSVLVLIDDQFGRSIKVGNFPSQQFSHGDLHDNYANNLPVININADIVDNAASKSNYKYNSEVQFILSGELKMEDLRDPNKDYSHFIGLGTVVTQTHEIAVDRPITVTVPVHNQNVQVLQLLDKDGNMVLRSSGQINSRESAVADRTVTVEVVLPEFRDVDTNEAIPTAELKCLPFANGGVCDDYSTTGANDVRMTQVQSTLFDDLFTVDLQVPQQVPAGIYGVEVMSADRDQTALRTFGVIQETVAEDCAVGKEKFENGMCVEIVTAKCDDPNLQFNTRTGACEPREMESETCAEGLTGTPPKCTDPNNPGAGDGEEPIDTTKPIELDAFFQYTIKYAGEEQEGTANRETFEVMLTPQAFIGTVGEGSFSLAEIQANILMDVSKLPTPVAVKSGTVANRAQVDVLVNGQVELQNINIDYPFRTHGQILPNGLASFGTVGIQPTEIIDDAKNRLNAQGQRDPLELLTNDFVEVRLTFSNTFEMTAGGKSFKGAVSSMDVKFPFTFLGGTVTPDGTICDDPRQVVQDGKCITPTTNTCTQPGETLYNGKCVPFNNPTGNQCDPTETKLDNPDPDGTPAFFCIPIQPTNIDGTCTAPLVPDPTTGGCVRPSTTQEDPMCTTAGGVPLFSAECINAFFVQTGNPTATQTGAGSCLAGETPEQCNTRLMSISPLAISGGTVTLIIVVMVVLIIGVVIIAGIRAFRSDQRQ